jgi:hypothetical protein
MKSSWTPVPVALFLLFLSWPPALSLVAVPLRARWRIPEAIVRQVIDHTAFEVFLHPEIPGRVPLIISDHLLVPDIRLTQFGRPVVVVRDQEVESRPCLRFKDFEFKGSRVVVTFTYGVEGVRGQFDFIQANRGTWQLVAAKVSEE